jgi:iron(III) transport system substrate-binding protein
MAQPAATKGLVLYASHPTAMVDYYIKGFEQQNPGVKVELITGGTGDLLGRVKAEKDRPRGDILWGGSSTTGGSAPELFVKYTPPGL